MVVAPGLKKDAMLWGTFHGAYDAESNLSHWEDSHKNSQIISILFNSSQLILIT